jgi:succinyl-diaminopimelate desuccinylase
MPDDIVNFLKEMINIPSVTPEDKGVQQILSTFLDKLGFSTTSIPHPPVSNIWSRIGEKGPLIVFAGHTDVVPAGEAAHWDTPPFEATIKENKLFGRGACDMKGSIAAMAYAVKDFLNKVPDFNGSLGFLITSGEEGDQFDLGTPKVMDFLSDQNINIDYCIVGEPSSHTTLGDVIKIGRRGSLTGIATVVGTQGHVAYPQLAKNPIHLIAPVLKLLTEKQYDEGNTFFPPTSFQISNIHAGTGAGNVIPGLLTFKFNFRYSTEVTHLDLINEVEKMIKAHSPLQVDIAWRHNGAPFLTQKGKLIDATIDAIKKHTGTTPELSTSGGTSDGRFIAPYGVELIELGPQNATIHQTNEEISLEALHELKCVYQTIIETLLTPQEKT